MKAALALQNTLPESLLEDPFLSPYFESFFSVDIHVLIRFGKWREILEREIPSNSKVHISYIYVHV
jgi:hypothetical protein